MPPKFSLGEHEPIRAKKLNDLDSRVGALETSGALTDGDKGDVLVSGGGTAMTVQGSAGDFAAGGNVTLPAAKSVTIPTPSSAVALRVGTLPAISAWGGFFLGASFNGSAWVLDDTAKNGWFYKLDARSNAGGILNGMWVYRIPQGANPHSDETPKFGVTTDFAYVQDGLAIGYAPVAGAISAPTTGYKLDVNGAIMAVGGIRPGLFTVAALPAASSSTGMNAFVTNGTRANRPVYSDGTNWRYHSDDTVVS